MTTQGDRGTDESVGLRVEEILINDDLLRGGSGLVHHIQGVGSEVEAWWGIGRAPLHLDVCSVGKGESYLRWEGWSYGRGMI